MIVAVASRKASPGVTSLTAWLAHLWDEPGTVRLVVEADPSGGTLAARWSGAHGLTWEPGLLTLSTSRTPITSGSLAHLAQPVAPDLFVAAAPPVADQVAGALVRWGDRGAAELAALPGLRAFVDCGRLGAGSPALLLARRAALTVLVCRPRLDEVSALVPAVAELEAAGCTLGLVCIGQGPYAPAEVAAAAGLPLLGVLPVDERTAAAFDRHGLHLGRGMRRSPLVRTIADLVGVVRSRTAALLHPDAALVAAATAPAAPGPTATDLVPGPVPADLGAAPPAPPARAPISAVQAPAPAPMRPAPALAPVASAPVDAAAPAPGPIRAAPAPAPDAPAPVDAAAPSAAPAEETGPTGREPLASPAIVAALAQARVRAGNPPPDDADPASTTSLVADPAARLVARPAEPAP